MGERLDLGRADRKVGVEEMGEPQPVSLGGKTQQPAISVESIGPSGFEELETGLLATVDQPLPDASAHAEDEVERIRPEPGDLDDLGHAGGVQAAKPRPGFDIFEGCHLG